MRNLNNDQSRIQVHTTPICSVKLRYYSYSTQNILEALNNVHVKITGLFKWYFFSGRNTTPKPRIP